MIKLKEIPSQANFTKLPNASQKPQWLYTTKIILRPIQTLESSQQKYGDIYYTEFNSFPPQLVISDPQAIEEILTTDSKLFASGAGNQIIQPLVGANSLILLDGDRHLQQRKLLMPPFHGERMRAYGQIIRDITEQVTSQWTIGQPFVARASMQEISLQVILRSVFGLEEGERYQQIKQILVAMLNTFNSPISAILLFFKSLQKDLGAWSPWGKFARRKQLLDQLLYQEINERREQGKTDGEDILSLLMSARDEAGQPMSDVELRDELMTMLFAGHETTAIALAWALYWIHYVPEVREKLLQELNSIDITNADPMAIAQLPYLKYQCRPNGDRPVAIFEMKLVLATILSRYSLELLDKVPLQPVRRGIVFAPAGGVHLAVREKFS